MPNCWASPVHKRIVDTCQAADLARAGVRLCVSMRLCVRVCMTHNNATLVQQHVQTRQSHEPLHPSVLVLLHR